MVQDDMWEKMKKLNKSDLIILRKLFADCAKKPIYPNIIKILTKKNIIKSRNERKNIRYNLWNRN